jgi:hypothetical protein
VAATKGQLLELLERHYRGLGWKPTRHDDGTVRASGIGGVTWIGLAVVQGDFEDAGFADRLRELAAVRMPRGELCPLELLPDEASADRLRELLERLRLRERGHVEVYSVAA